MPKPTMSQTEEYLWPTGPSRAGALVLVLTQRRGCIDFGQGGSWELSSELLNFQGQTFC